MDKFDWMMTTLAMVALIALVSWWDNEQQKIDGDSGIYNQLSPDRNDWKLPKRETSSAEEKPFKKSLHHMTKILHNFTEPQQTLENLTSSLSKRGLQPKVFKDSNPYTGNMYIIRTQNALKGTRYFHAEYFSSDNEKPFLRYMSFELRPGKRAMKEAVDSLHKNFPNLGIPVSQETNFLTWKWKNSYTLWVRRLDAQDIKDGDSYNAYSPEDIGTIQVSIEMDLHGHDVQAHSH